LVRLLPHRQFATLNLKGKDNACMLEEEEKETAPLCFENELNAADLLPCFYAVAKQRTKRATTTRDFQS
jgi:hypothetical protein